MLQSKAQPKHIIDLRKHHRIIAPSSALFSFKQRIAPAQLAETGEGEDALLNLSIGGCRLVSDVPLMVGEEYNLILQVSMDRAPIPVDAAVVRWADYTTYGLKFISIDPQDESRLHDLLIEIRRPTS